MTIKITLITNTLNQNEITKLKQLGKDIKISLDVDLNGTGIPPRTDRLQAVKDMIEYLNIHNYQVIKRLTKT